MSQLHLRRPCLWVHSGTRNIDLLVPIVFLGSAIVSGFLILFFIFLFFFFFFFFFFFLLFSAGGLLPLGLFLLLRHGFGLLPVPQFIR